MGDKRTKNYDTDQFFGNSIDYFLFSARTLEPLFSFAGQLADHCNCHFNLMPDLRLPKSADCQTDPVFRLMYAQYDESDKEEHVAVDPVERLNILIFQNKALSFDRSKSRRDNSNTLLLFPELDTDCDFFAFSHRGLQIFKQKVRDFAEYYVFVFAKKNMYADKLADHISRMPDCIMTEITPVLFKTTHSKNKLTPTTFFRYVLAFSENQIRQIMRNNEKQFIGRIPQSMLPPPALTQLLNKLSISKSEITINNF